MDELADGAVADPDPAAAVALIAQLPPEQRQVVALRFVLELTPGEIAALLDLPRGTVNSRLRRGLDALGAEERAWPAVREAFAARERVPVRRHWRTPVVAAAAVALVAAAATPPGQAVAGFVRDRIVRDAPRGTAPEPLATRTGAASTVRPGPHRGTVTTPRAPVASSVPSGAYASAVRPGGAGR